MSISRPRILFLVHRIPYPPNRGDRIRSFHLLEFLAERAEVALGFLSEQRPPAEALEALESRCVWVGWARWGRWRRWWQAAWCFLQGKTATQGLFASAELRRQLQEGIRGHRPDAVLVFCSSMVQYLDLPGLASGRIVVDLVDVDSQKWLEYAQWSRGWRRWAYQQEGRRLRKLEAEIGRRGWAVMLTGPHEAAIYRQIAPETNIYVVPNGVDLEYFRPDFRPEGQPPSGPPSRSDAWRRCVFVGALDYQANIDGLRWFCQEVWPQVRRQHPEAEFVVVGSHPTKAVHRMAGRTPGVRLVGPVGDVRPYLAEAEVVVVPLRVARGIQNKVLEALAMGKAVLASPQALEGLAVRPGTEAESAETPGDWVKTLLALWSHRERREQLGRAGRRYVESHHRWEEVLRPVASLLGLPEAPRGLEANVRWEEKTPLGKPYPSGHAG